jgi:hypothetical protein
MREYQLQGLNWLIHLYDNGINGILADEMVCLHPAPQVNDICFQGLKYYWSVGIWYSFASGPLLGLADQSRFRSVVSLTAKLNCTMLTFTELFQLRLACQM